MLFIRYLNQLPLEQRRLARLKTQVCQLVAVLLRPQQTVVFADAYGFRNQVLYQVRIAATSAAAAAAAYW